MDGFQAGIHALLQDIDSDYGKNEKEQYPLPYSRPNLNTYQPHIAQPTYSGQTSAPIYDKQQLSTAMPMTLPEIDHYQPHEDISLDKFGEQAKYDVR